MEWLTYKLSASVIWSSYWLFSSPLDPCHSVRGNIYQVSHWTIVPSIWFWILLYHVLIRTNILIRTTFSPWSRSHVGLEVSNRSTTRTASHPLPLGIIWLTSVTVAGHETSTDALDLVGSGFAPGKDSTLYRFHGNKFQSTFQRLEKLMMHNSQKGKEEKLRGGVT